MGKKGGTSWLTAVKRAFRSPTKDSPEKVRNCRRKEDHHDPAASSEDQNDRKKREKKRWLFKKSTNPQEPVGTLAVQQGSHGGAATGSAGEQTHAIAVAVATAAQAAIEVARISRTTSRGNYAAIVIQTAFRGYLARRALGALKGLVKLQAFVRGYNVRKQAKMTLKCMQALVRVQARVLDERMRLSHEGSRKSTFSDTSSLLESRYLQDIVERRSLSHSREPSSIADDWDERPHTIEEVKAMLQARKEVALKQIWRSDRSSVGEEELEEKPRWLDRWMASKQWDSSIRTPSCTLKSHASTDHRDSIKTVEMDTSYLAPNFRRSITSLSQYQSPYNNQRPASPRHSRANQHQSHQQQPVTPSPARTRPIQICSASPRSIREDRGYSSSVTQTPSLRSNYYYNNGNLQENHRVSAISSGVPVPNYMTSTESAKARLRSQSAPRHSPSTPEQERGGPKKRLSFPNPSSDSCSDLGYVGHANLRSPSLKSAVPMGLGIGIGIGMGMAEKQSNYSSCSDSLGGEISPSSTSGLRRWLS